jgi:hypothetical protein
MFPSHTIELTNHTRDEKPVQKMNRHVPAFQLEASVRCQVSGTDAEVKASREKTVNAWLAAGILEQDGWGKASGQMSEIWRWGYARLLLWIRADGKQVVGSGASTGRKRMWVEIQEQSGTDTTECLRILKRVVGERLVPPTPQWLAMGKCERNKRETPEDRRGVEGRRTSCRAYCYSPCEGVMCINEP